MTFLKRNSDKNLIYILDIDLNETINGLHLAREIRKIDNYDGEMIFVTNHSELCFKVFQYKLRVLEFIDKSYNLTKQLEDSLDVAVNIIKNKDEKVEEKKLIIKFGQHVFNIPLKEIVYIETLKSSKKLVLYTLNDRYEFYGTIKEIKELLDENFIQSHKITLVNKRYIRSINKDPNNLHINMKNGMECSLSRGRIKEVIENWI